MIQSSKVEVRDELERELQRLTAGDPFAALSLDYDADGNAVRAAFLSATKVYHPNRFGRHDAGVRALATEVFLVIKKSYESLQSDEARSKLLVELGKVEPLAGGDVEESASTKASKTSRSRHRSSPVRRSFRRPRSEARRRHAEGTSENDRVSSGTSDRPSVRLPRMPTAAEKAAAAVKARAEREQTFRQAVTLCNKGDFGGARAAFHELALLDSQERSYRVWMHYAWGREHQAAKRAEDARAEYNRALTLNPRFTEAQDAMASLDAETRKRGVFSRLFRK